MKRSAGQGEFHFPKDGIMLTYAAGQREEDGLKIKVKFNASSGRSLTLNGEALPETQFGLYRKEFVLRDYKTTLTVKDRVTGEEWHSDVYFLKRAYKKYRISLDDNIWFLQNLTEHKDEYQSMFEDPYLALLKSVHDKYGSKFHINLYYETPRHGGFDLSRMTDKFKEEFRANSHWMRLSFHANADEPPRPYWQAPYEQAYFEMERVHKEILRFAGEEAFAKTVTTIHCGECTVEAAKAFRDLGVKAFIASYRWDTDGDLDIRMYCDAEQCALLNKYGFYYDKELDIVHFSYYYSIQHADPKDFREGLKKKAEAMPKYPYREFCLHEQYFYPEFPLYQNNYYEKLCTVAELCRQDGYEPCFADELFEFDSH